MEGMLRVKEAAKFLNQSTDSIYQMAHRGTLPSYKIEGSKALYFKPDDLREYQNSRKQLLKLRRISAAIKPKKKSAPTTVRTH